MDALVTGERLFFGDFRLEPRSGQLFRRDAPGGWAPVPIGSRAIEILHVLISHPGTVVSKDAIMDAVWPGIAIEPNNLTVQIAALRRALDEGGDGGSCIQTVPGRGYRLALDVTPAAEAQPDPPPVLTTPTSSPGIWPAWLTHCWLIMLAGTVTGVALLLSAGWLVGWFSSAPVQPRLSIVVLPLDNLSGDAKDDYLAEGITDDLTTDLANVTHGFVIGRSSAYSYKGKPIDVKQIGQELGVRYAIEGSMRRLGDVLRINVQLVSTESGAQLWTDHLDEPIKELADGQQEIVARLASASRWALVRDAAARSERRANPDAFDLFLRARALMVLPYTPERYAEARQMLERALQLDRSFADAQALLAGVLVNLNSIRGAIGDPDEFARASVLVGQAAALSPDSVPVLAVSVFLRRMQWHWPAAMAAAQRMMDLYPNDGEANNQLATMKLTDGALDEAIPLLERSVRIDPHSQWVHERYQRLGYAQMMLGRPRQAMPWLLRALASSPDNPGFRAWTYRQLAVAQALAANLREARQALAEAVRLDPFATARGDFEWYGSETAIAQTRRYQGVLRSLGLRDHADEDADFGVAPDRRLHRVIAGYTPTTAPGVTTIRTDDLVSFLAQSRPLVIDTLSGYLDGSLPGAIGLRWSGRGGDLADATQQRLRSKMAELTNGNASLPIVVVGRNSERFDGYNLSLRLVALGYTKVYWYRGGRETWEAKGLPEAEAEARDW